MKIPYYFVFPEQNTATKVAVGKLPSWSTLKLFFARQKWLYTWGDVHIVSQQLNHRPFFIDLVEINTNKDTKIPFMVNGRQLLLFFMLKGQVSFSTDIGEPIVNARHKSFLMLVYEEGKYYFKTEKGCHMALVISILPEWIASISDNLPNLKKLVEIFDSEVHSYTVMNQCKIDRKVSRWLLEIYRSSVNNLGAMDGNLRKYISSILENYNFKIDISQSNLAIEVKRYIQNHYSDSNLNVRFLADYFSVTERTLLNHFKREYNVSVQYCYTNLRMRTAMQLESQGLSVKNIYSQVGYLDEHSFRKTFRKYKKSL